MSHPSTQLLPKYPSTCHRPPTIRSRRSKSARRIRSLVQTIVEFLTQTSARLALSKPRLTDGFPVDEPKPKPGVAPVFPTDAWSHLFLARSPTGKSEICALDTGSAPNATNTILNSFYR